MSVKSKLRKKYLLRRAEVSAKKDKDKLICERLLNSEEFKSAQTVLCYVSLNDEVCTDGIINSALSLGKAVAVPYCVNKQGVMNFYIINSLDDLSIGTFNVREPDINLNKKLEDFEKSIIIVPGVVFSLQGYRLGYGGGYYDRFLSTYNGISVGLCYDELLCETLPQEKYDKSVDIVLTEKQTIYTIGG